MFQGLVCFALLVWLIKLEEKGKKSGKGKGKGKGNKDGGYFFFDNFVDRG